MVAAVALADVAEAFGETAFGDELLFEVAELAVQKVVGLVNEADEGVGGDFGRGFLYIGLVGPIGPIGLIGDPSDRLGLGVVFGPEGQGSLAEEVFVIQEQLFQAGAGDAGELQFGLLRRRGGLTGFGDVLLARARGLDHLVGGARPVVDEARNERDGGVVNDLRGLIGFELALTAMRANQIRGMGLIGPIGPIGPIGRIGPVEFSAISLHARYDSICG